jgi:hypothetical protein
MVTYYCFIINKVLDEFKNERIITFYVTPARIVKRRKRDSESPKHISDSDKSWSDEEILLLREAVRRFGTKNWVIVADVVKSRSAEACRSKYGRLLRSTEEIALPILRDFARSQTNFSRIALQLSGSIMQDKQSVEDEDLQIQVSENQHEVADEQKEVAEQKNEQKLPESQE